MELHQQLAAIRRADPRALARAISAVENRSPEVLPLLKALYASTGQGLVVGITGSPGGGKSTLADELVGAFRRRHDKVAIVAVDPSSPFSGGAILGDRIRMQKHGLDSGTFIRSMATRGQMGGLAAATHDVITLLDAAGYSIILVETVGAGQDEVDVVRIADVVVLVLVPGMGDDVQTIKAGLMEIADIFVINKSDRPGVEKLEQQLQALLELQGSRSDWTSPIVRTIASEGKGIDQLAEGIEAYVNHRQSHPEHWRRRRLQAVEYKLLELLREQVIERVCGAQLADGKLSELAATVLDRSRDPYSVVEEIVAATIKEQP